MFIYKGDIPVFKEATAVIPGIFDGIHIGHQELIKKAIESSNSKKIAPCIFTFKQHPKSGEYLLPPIEREEILKGLSIKYLIVANFNKIKSLSPYEYIEILCSKLKMKEIWCGSDYGFGKERGGNVEMLKTLGKEKGFSVCVIDDMCFNDKRVSTSYIKSLFLAGKTKEANLLLTRPFSLSGIVFPSSLRGRRFGFKTANIIWDKDLFIPRRGVYFVKIKIGKRLFPGMANLGERPTFNEKNLMLETHIFDFNKNIYGKEIRVFFLQWIRDEIRFNNPSRLYLQIKEDEKLCRVLSNAFPLNDMFLCK